jgi:hypothetical protein
VAKIDGGREQISVWVLKDDLRRAEKLVPFLAKDLTLGTAGVVTRSTVLRLAVRQGLDQLEKRYR